MTEKPDIMNTQEVAKYLGVHTMTVYKHFKAKKLPGFKVGGSWRTFKTKLDQHLLDSGLDLTAKEAQSHVVIPKGPEND